MAHSRDNLDNQIAQLIARQYPRAKRLAPDKDASWLNHWQRQVEERKRQAAMPAPPRVQPVVERPRNTGLSR